MWKSLQTPAAKRREDEIRDINRVRSIKITLASPDQIRSWSYGEVKNPETIDYKTYKPKPDGLFCERIFGPTRDYECACGKFKGIKHRGVVCDRCGVEVTQSKVRRSRIGSIELEMPVAHIWFSKSVPSRMATLLDMSIKVLERVLYYEEYIVLDPGPTGLNKMDVLSEREFAHYREEYGGEFRVGMGAEAIKEVLKDLDLDALAQEMRNTIRDAKSKQKIKKSIKRLKVIEDFRHSDNRTEWMIMEVLPVLPPDLRPLVPLDGGRFATSDLNDLYRRVINRNNRLRRLKEVRAPEVIIRNEKRMLQESVDALLDNGRRGRPVKGSNNRPLKSMSDMLKGKQGRFRQNLLGKRVDYSGRSVIVCGPELKFHECGLPKKMALELFEPFIIRRLEELDEVTTIRSAKRKIERGDPEVFDVLEEVIQDHPVLLNRAPTLHRMGIQAFQPRLVEGKAIHLHPLTCTAFNADFDGDQMAVHLPLSKEAQAECRNYMLSTNNILSPSSGEAIATPSQDIVLGLYYLTKVRKRISGSQPKRFTSETEAVIAYDHNFVELQDEIEVRIEEAGRIRTTIGRILFNQVLPKALRFINETQKKKSLSKLVSVCYQKCGKDACIQFLDDMKALGYYHAKKSGTSISLSHMIVPKDKEDLLNDARKDVQLVTEQFEKGAITDIERYNKVIDRWIHTTEAVADSMMKELEEDNEGFNPVYIMADSGARGSRQQIRQLAGMRGLMSKPMKKLTGGIGEIIESPIESNFKEGLTVLEYFISTHGARKGLADTALKTAEAGYLTRRLVDVAQDVIITEDDCGTLLGLEVSAIKEGDHIIESIEDRVIGRHASNDIYNPLNGNLIVKAGELIEEEAAAAIGRCGIETTYIRSVVACESPRGVCSKCYGRDLARREPVNIGQAVGIIAAQSIGEPGTQLTLRTFHIGGTTSRILEESELRVRMNDDGIAGLRDGETGIMKYINLKLVTNRQKELVAINNLGKPYLLRSSIVCPDSFGKSEPIIKFENLETVSKGRKLLVIREGGSIILTNTRGKEYARFPNIPVGALLHVKEEDRISSGTKIAEWNPLQVPVIAKQDGKVSFDLKLKDLEKHEDHYIIPRSIDNEVLTVSKGGDSISYDLQPGHHLLVKNGDEVKSGDVIAYHTTPTIARSEGKVRYKDIVDSVTLRRVLDPVTNNLKSVITDYTGDKTPRIVIVDRNEDVLEEHTLPPGSVLKIENDADILSGMIIAHTEQLVDEFRMLSAGIPLGATVFIPEGEAIHRNGKDILDAKKKPANVIARWDPYFKAEIAAADGKAKFDQIIEGVTMRRTRPDGGNRSQMIIMEHREDKQPSILIQKKGKEDEYHSLPSGAHITANDGEEIKAGDILAKIPKETFKSRDVTGGLPRIEELFEARRPKQKDLAVIATVDGWIKIPKPEEITDEIGAMVGKKRKRGTRIILITDKNGEVLTANEIDAGKHVIVSDGDWISAGNKLVDGSIDTHEYLEIMGERATQEYLVNEIQEVYRLQGVGINDKHIEIIVRQMMRKVTITDAGDTRFLLEDDVDRHQVRMENDRVLEQGGKPAQFKPKLLGITKASLGTESFISAASFQETTRVLTSAAIAGKSDYLLGLKENVIMGHLIPAGTGWDHHFEYYKTLLDRENLGMVESLK